MEEFNLNSQYINTDMSDAELLEYIKAQPHATPTRHPNWLKIPVTNININHKGAIIFNRIIAFFEDYCEGNEIVRTRSHGISIKGFLRLPCMDIRVTNTLVELTALTGFGFYRFQFRTLSGDFKEAMYGRQAFKIFKKFCVKHKIDLNALKIPNGEEIKAQIEPAIIDMVDENLYNKSIDNVHHIDVHSAWAGFACKEYPVLLPVFQELFDKRKEHPDYKLVIVESLGMFQSLGLTKASWAHISKAGINGTNAYMRQLAKKLEDAGRKPILFNTDGIWYQGEVYHGEGEGSKMGEWSNDHVDVIIRIKGRRAYEYVEANGEYHVVLSGLTYLDKYKDRSNWEWGDLYNRDCELVKFIYDFKTRRIYEDGR